MDVDLIFKIAAVGILVAVLNQLLVRSGREEQAMMTTLAGSGGGAYDDGAADQRPVPAGQDAVWVIKRWSCMADRGVGTAGRRAGRFAEKSIRRSWRCCWPWRYAGRRRWQPSVVCGRYGPFWRTCWRRWRCSSTLFLPLKTAGIAVVTRIGADLCRDAGESAVASAVEMAGAGRRAGGAAPDAGSVGGAAVAAVRATVFLMCLLLLAMVPAWAADLPQEVTDAAPRRRRNWRKGLLRRHRRTLLEQGTTLLGRLCGEPARERC